MPLKQFTIDFRELGKDLYLRNDEKYHMFLHFSNWNLFESKSKSLISLKDILIDDYNNFEYEDGEEYKGIPTGQTYLDDDGYIKGFDLVTNEDHPGRLKYKVSNNNILISSLRLAKSPALHFKEQNLSDYVFSNGFYIYKIKNGWNKKFILYILRTKRLKDILDNHIYRGIGISAYKDDDLKKIKIPFIPKMIQDQIVAQIELIEKKIKELKGQITPAQEIINKVFAREFKFDLEKFEELKKEKFFEVEFSNFSNYRNLKFNCRTLKSTKSDFKLSANVKYLKIKNVAKEIFAGGDKPKTFSEEETEICKYPIFSNGKDKNGLFGYTNVFRVAKPCVTISARGTIGFSVARNEKFLPIVRLITIITDEERVLNQYLEHALNFINIEKSGNTIAQLTTPMISDIEVPILSIENQQKIVDEIKVKLDRQEEMKQKIEAERVKIDEIIEKVVR